MTTLRTLPILHILIVAMLIGLLVILGILATVLPRCKTVTTTTRINIIPHIVVCILKRTSRHRFEVTAAVAITVRSLLLVVA